MDIVQGRSSSSGYCSRGLIKTQEGQEHRNEVMKKEVFSPVAPALMGSSYSYLTSAFLACQSPGS